MNRSPPPEAIGGLLRETFRAMIRRVEHEFDQTDLALSQWMALRLIDTGTIACVGDVCRELGLDSGTSTRLIDQLELKCLIRRQRSGRDRRIVSLFISEAGRELVCAMQPRLRSFWSSHLEIFSAEEKAQLFTLLGRLRERLAIGPMAEDGCVTGGA